MLTLRTAAYFAFVIIACSVGSHILIGHVDWVLLGVMSIVFVGSTLANERKNQQS